MPVEVVTIDLLGTTFTVQTDESREYMDVLVAELNLRLNSLRSTTRVSDPLKLSVLASITILDDLVRLRRETGGEEFSRVAARLIGRLDETLALSASDESGLPSP